MEECIEIDTVKILCLILIRKRSLIFRYCIVLLARYNRSKINFDKIKNEFLVRDISNSENVQFSLENSRSYLFENNFFFLPLFFSWNSINCETSLKRLLWLLKYKRFKFASNGMLYLCLHLSTRSGKLLTITVHYSKLINSLIKTL